MAAFRIFIADDHEVVRKGLCALLQAEQGWEVCGEAADGREATEKIRELKPDVSILDIGMPGLNGLEATRQILKDDPRAKVLVLTFHDSDQVVRDVLNAGARGFLLKSDAARDLVVAIEALRRDKTFFHVQGRSHGARGIFERWNQGSCSSGGTRPTHAPRARGCAVTGRREEHERGRGRAGTECEDRRDSPLEYHAQAPVALGQRPGALRRPEQYCSRSSIHNRLADDGPLGDSRPRLWSGRARLAKRFTGLIPNSNLLQLFAAGPGSAGLPKATVPTCPVVTPLHLHADE